MGAQIIWAIIAFATMFIIGLFVTKDKVGNKKTKNGFHTDEMQKVYDRYINKEMQYGQS